MAVQHAYSLWPSKLMGREGKQVDVLSLHIDRKPTRCLHPVGVEGDALVPADSSDFLHRLDGADFIVGVQDADQKVSWSMAASTCSGARKPEEFTGR